MIIAATENGGNPMENDLISRKALINQHCAVNCGCTRSQCGFTKEEDGADCCTFVKEIEAAPAVEAEPKWISVEERLPENFDTVIIWRNDCRNACIGWLIDDRWSVPKGVKVTHWMPLPEAPKEE